MGRVISIASQKGGVGKTTTAIKPWRLPGAGGSQGPARRHRSTGQRDQRCWASTATTSSWGRTEVLIGHAEAKAAIQPTGVPALEVLPTGQRLSGAEVELVGMLARETRLRSCLAKVRDDYDFVLIDSPLRWGS
jgi:chromosome partitioning protein